MDLASIIETVGNQILKYIEPRGELLTHLLSEDIVDFDDLDRIRQQKERRKMAEMVLDLVSNRSLEDETVKERFINCLKNTGQQHVVTLLNEDVENEQGTED